MLAIYFEYFMNDQCSTNKSFPSGDVVFSHGYVLKSYLVASDCPQLKSIVEINYLARGHVEYNHLFSDVHKQKEATVLFAAREYIMNTDPPRAILDPSTSSCSCSGDVVFTHPVLTVLPSGK